MTWADDLAGLDLRTIEGLAVVSAAVFDGVKVVTAAHDDDRQAVDFDGEGSGLGEVRSGAYIDPGHVSSCPSTLG